MVAWQVLLPTARASAAPAWPRTAAKQARPKLGRELLLGIAVAGCYVAVALWGNSRGVAAERNGAWLLSAEERLGMAVELTANRWLGSHTTLAAIASYEYAVTYVVTTFTLLGWVYVRRPALYRPARNSLVVLNLLALATFLVLPTAPPRLLAASGFVDTVAQHRPPGTWGTGVISALGDRFAAMPSLHVAWAVWFLLLLAAATRSRLLTAISVAHVLLTVLVIVVTGNHYLLDAVAGAGLAAGSTVPFLPVSVRRERVAPSDAFFLHVEDGGVPQLIGGIALVDERDARPATRDEVVAAIAGRLPGLPDLQRVVVRRTGRSPVWAAPESVDVSRQVTERRLRTDDASALDAAVAELIREPLPRDRPLWRLTLLCADHGRPRAAVFLMHHCLADGPQAVRLIADALSPPGRSLASRPAPVSGRERGGWLPRIRRGGQTLTGFAALATQGPAAQLRLPPRPTPGEPYARGMVPMRVLRAAARRADVGVTDVLVAAVADALDQVGAAGRRLRVAVPLAQRITGVDRRVGAVLVDVPLGPLAVTERAAAISQALRAGRASGRVTAAATVMRVFGRLPAPVHAATARRIYGRRHFSVIVSLFPGTTVPRLHIGATPLGTAHPVLPLAAGVPLSVGAMHWGDALTIAATTEPARLDAGEVVAATVAAIESLAAGGMVRTTAGDGRHDPAQPGRVRA